jgi:hypothetical protein
MEGSCHCGSIKFKAQGTPNWLGACYCVDCRKVSGAPYLAFAQIDTVEFTKGTPKKYSSSEKVERSFCENCGASISYAFKEQPNKLFMCVGLFDDINALAPKDHIFIQQKASWIP